MTDAPDDDAQARADELALVLRALSGRDAETSRAAFEELIPLHARRVHAAAFAILGDRAEAEDASQDTFVRAFRRRGSLREPEKFGPWLLTIARRAALDRCRRRRPSEPLTDTLPDPASPAPDTHLATAERRAGVLRALAALPERPRLALNLRYLDGLDHGAIRRALDLTDGALRGVLSRALAGLRETLRAVDADERPPAPRV